MKEQPEQSDKTEEILKLTAVINSQSNYIIDHEQRIIALLRTIERLEGINASLRKRIDISIMNLEDGFPDKAISILRYALSNINQQNHGKES